MSALFPQRFGGAELEALHAAEQQQRRAVALGQWLATGHPRYVQQLDELNAWALDQLKPDIYDVGDPRDVLLLHERAFGANCAALAAQGYPNAASLSLLDYFSAIEHLSKRAKPD